VLLPCALYCSNGLPCQSDYTVIPIPLSLYLHFPWCVSKCPYCDFNSHGLRKDLPEAQYLNALRYDLENQLNPKGPLLIGAPSNFLQGRMIETIFMGGGTPSLFTPASIAHVLEMVSEFLPIAANAEITLEANPGTIERGRFSEYAAVGINRISLGAQTFNNAALKTLGRIHSPYETHQAVAQLHAAGLSNFNIDLMYGLPKQDAAGALHDVRSAIELQPAQISHYHLTMEPGTVFAAQPPKELPEEDTVELMLEQCQQALAEAGYQRYEISAYAKPQKQCAHNLNYWQFGDYLGVGAGAHGKLSWRDPEVGSLIIRRTHQIREPRRYLHKPSAHLRVLEVPIIQRPFEFMLNALRLLGGVERNLFESRTGVVWQSISSQLISLAERGCLEIPALQSGILRPTARGIAFLNDLLLPFLPSR